MFEFWDLYLHNAEFFIFITFVVLVVLTGLIVTWRVNK